MYYFPHNEEYSTGAMLKLQSLISFLKEKVGNCPHIKFTPQEFMDLGFSFFDAEEIKAFKSMLGLIGCLNDMLQGQHEGIQVTSTVRGYILVLNLDYIAALQ